jgi:conserved oligomeric Golgi complex subunit 3
VVLSKIYRSVEIPVFEDLAGEAVGLCTDSLKHGSLEVTAKCGDSIEGDLFLIKHLLILREQLTPFEINFSQLKRKLDFTSTGKVLIY